MRKKRVVFVFPRGEAIRNFVYSGTAKMIRKEAELVIISVVPNDDVKKELEEVSDRFIELEKGTESYKVRLIREVLDLAHNRFIWTAASKLRFELRDKDARSTLQKVKRSLKKWAATRYASHSKLYQLSRLEERVSRKEAVTIKWEKVLKDLQPDVVFNGSHIHNKISLPIIHAAKKLGIHTSTFLFSWDNLTSQGRIIPSYDQYMVWNKAIQKDLLEMYPHLNEEQTSVVGTPQFDFHFKKEWFNSKEGFATEQNLDATKKWVLYTTGMPNHMPFEPEIVEQIADILKEYPEKPQLILRVYPKDTTQRFDDLKRRRPDIHFQQVPWEANWLTPLKEDLKLFTNTLRHVDLGLNVASTVSLELAIFDKPVINVAYNPPSLNESDLKYADYYEFEHYKRVVSYGGIDLARTKEDLKRLIFEALENPLKNKEERKKLITNFFGNNLDGHSSERIVNHIL